MKKCALFLKIILIIILVLSMGWYLFGEFGPFEGALSITTATDEEEGQVAQENLDTSETAEADQEDVAEAEEETEVNSVTTLVFTGDVEISEYVQANYDASGVDGVASEEVQSLLKDATFTMINNEFCFSERGEQAQDKQYTFRVNPSYVSLLTDLGVDIAGLANNHVLDFGHDALTDTFTTLAGAGIDYTGAGDSLAEAANLIVKTDDLGRSYGFLAASHVIPEYSWDVRSSTPGEFTFYDDTELINRITEASSQVDYLFVMVHWGTEHTTELDDYQVTEGHKFIDAGATAVIGMHSHCLQPIEYYNGHVIYYSLGNFIFNTTINSGGAAEITVDENGDITYAIVPVLASNAKTDLAVKTDSNIFNYIENFSETVLIDDDGVITSR